MDTQQATKRKTFNQEGWNFFVPVGCLVASGHIITPVNQGYNDATICDVSGIGYTIMFPNQDCLVIRRDYDSAVEFGRQLLTERCPFRYSPRYPKYIVPSDDPVEVTDEHLQDLRAAEMGA